MNNAHLFALFSARLPEHLANNTTITFADTDIWLRITQVLRLKVGEQIIIFNDSTNALITLGDGTFSNKKNVITGNIESINNQVALQPAIHLIVGLTKREAFEDILYTCAQMGVTSITPVLAKRIHRNWMTTKDDSRLKKIMIAGCEQGKQFVLPVLNQPEAIKRVLCSTMENAFVCSPNGKPLLPTLHKIALETPQEIILCVGPEGGFDELEEELLATSGTIPIALCKSILRSQDAVQVMVGALRSLAT